MVYSSVNTKWVSVTGVVKVYLRGKTISPHATVDCFLTVF